MYADNDDASTMWRPDLRPLPCRQTVRHTTGADGRHSFVVHADSIPPGTVVEISLCVEVSVIVVDQFPVLWDFVIIDAATQTVCAPGDAKKSVDNAVPTHAHLYLCVKPRRHACLYHMPRKSRPQPIPASLTCACHSRTWTTTMYVMVYGAIFVRVCLSSWLCMCKTRMQCAFLCLWACVYVCVWLCMEARARAGGGNCVE